MSTSERPTDLPAADLIDRGIADLRAGRESEESLLTAMAATRLRRLGLDVPDVGTDDPEHRLYALLAARDARSAHSRYNALVGQVVSFARAAERARAR
jgi:hypothetical protein